MKVGKKTPLTLAHFGFAQDGTVLPDEALPASLVAEWQAIGANADKPFPSYARLLAQRDTQEADSRYSWTVDFAGRRTKAREAMQPSSRRGRGQQGRRGEPEGRAQAP